MMKGLIDWDALPVPFNLQASERWNWRDGPDSKLFI